MAPMDESVWRGKVFSGGWSAGDGGDAPVIEPATGQEIGRTGIAGPADVAHAAQLAAAAQPAWAATPHTERSAVLRRAASGTGARFGGTANLEAFTDTRWVTIRGDIAPYPF
ncbi:MAG TPA: aldehyde dehydrogenase family protein [Streptosporangiaceae bacterium]|nr:aldehyde dehydrogenase family protein [Streptosporangiaceae bacterium]